MSEANKQLIRRWYEVVWNQQSETGIDEMLAPDCRAHGLSGGDAPLIGTEGFKAFHRKFCNAFPDLKISVEDVVAEGDKVAARWKATMTHSGDSLGFPASGKKTTMDGSTLVIIRNGKIAEGWNHMDMGGLFAQLRGN